MKSICFITTGDIKNIATSKRALGLANPLVDLGYDVSILMEDTTENRKRVDMECYSQVKVFYFLKTGLKGEIKQKKDLLSDINPDIIYLCAFVVRNIPFFYKGKAKVFTEHSELQSGIEDVKGFKRIISLATEYYSIIKSDAQLCASKYLVDVFNKRKRFFKSDQPVFYFPYAFNHEIYELKERNNIPSKFNDFKSTLNFVFLGTITENYGVFMILEAFKKLSSKNENIRLLMLGRGRHYDRAKQFIKDNELEALVHMPGFIEEEDISNYFSLATAFLSPMNNSVQDWARCPSKLYMYLPFKKPVISCKIGETYETLKDSGYYYDSGNVDALFDRMKEIISFKATKYFSDFNMHNWETRATEFHKWYSETFNE